VSSDRIVLQHDNSSSEISVQVRSIDLAKTDEILKLMKNDSEFISTINKEKDRSNELQKYKVKKVTQPETKLCHKDRDGCEFHNECCSGKCLFSTCQKKGSSYPRINGEEYKHSMIKAAIRFHRIDANQDGFICCNETFEWNKSAFREAAKDGVADILRTMPRNHDPRENPCFTLEIYNDDCKNNEANCWPSFLSPQLIETNHDGKITPDEFEDELKVLSPSKLKRLMNDVKQHPIIWK